jgi:hypothetical protein
MARRRVPCTNLIYSSVQTFHVFLGELEVVYLGVLLDPKLGDGFGEWYETLNVFVSTSQSIT